MQPVPERLQCENPQECEEWYNLFRAVSFFNLLIDLSCAECDCNFISFKINCNFISPFKLQKYLKLLDGLVTNLYTSFCTQI